MTKTEWLEKVKEHASKLRLLIKSYHPATADGPRRGIGKITATAAEEACESVRVEIAAKEAGLGDPASRFDTALQNGDADEINSLLNSAWFGVPESIACWGIEGFSEAVDLMDDAPDYEGEMEQVG